MMKNSIIEPSNSDWSSPCVLVPKPDGSFRLCTDFRNLDAITKTNSYPISRNDDCIDRVGHAKYVSKLERYYQIPLTERAKCVLAFVTPSGLCHYRVMPFGLKNAPATFQRMINSLTSDLEGCKGYIDDVVVYSDTCKQHVQHLQALLEKLERAKLTVNFSKSEFGSVSGTCYWPGMCDPSTS